MVKTKSQFVLWANFYICRSYREKTGRGRGRGGGLLTLNTVNGNYKMKQNIKNRTISESYTDDKQSKYFSSPNDIFKTDKNVYEKLYAEAIATAELLTKTSNRKISQINNFTIMRQIIF